MAALTTAGGPEPAPVDVGAYKRAVGRFVTGVCVVTSRLDRHDHAMTANAFMSVSIDPLLVAVSVAEDTRFLEAVDETGAWGVSVLAESHRPAAAWLSTSGRPLVDQLARVPHRRGPVTGVALLEDALATLECRTTGRHVAGDHVLVVGEVLRVEAPAAVPPPLVYYQGAYRGLTGGTRPPT